MDVSFFSLFLFLGDGIYDCLNNEKILHKIWQSKEKGKAINNIHQFCGILTDAIIKYSMEEESGDNVSVIFIAFKNFENKMKDPNFEYTGNSKTQIIKDQFDFNIKK